MKIEYLNGPSTGTIQVALIFHQNNNYTYDGGNKVVVLHNNNNNKAQQRPVGPYEQDAGERWLLPNQWDVNKCCDNVVSAVGFSFSWLSGWLIERAAISSKVTGPDRRV